jgi:hypothetical protein
VQLLCGAVPETEVVRSSKIRISNRFGKTMQGVISIVEWGVGLVHEIHFPTTLEAPTAKEVRDPNFGQRTFNLQQPDLEKLVATVFGDPNCEKPS